MGTEWIEIFFIGFLTMLKDMILTVTPFGAADPFGL
jgi:hypothetical protein